MTIVMPPALDVSVGLSSANILKVDINYITKDNIVYGGSVGVRPGKTVIGNLSFASSLSRIQCSFHF